MHELAVSLTCVMMLVVPAVGAMMTRWQDDEELD